MKNIKGTPRLPLRLKLSLKQFSKYELSTITRYFKSAAFYNFLMKTSHIYTKYLRINGVKEQMSENS